MSYLVKTITTIFEKFHLMPTSNMVSNSSAFIVPTYHTSTFNGATKLLR